MTFADAVYHFLQVDNLRCANDGKQLSVFKGYYKMAMWPQFAFFTWRWFKQTWFGDNVVLRFCNQQCFQEFAAKGMKR